MSKATPLSKLDKEQARETALIDLAYGALRETNQPFYFRDLMQEVARLRGMTEQEIQDSIAMLYTEMNIDGRFVCIGNNVWGLKRWYPVDKTVEKATSSKKFVRKDLGDFDDDDDEVFLDEEAEEDEVFLDAEDDDVELAAVEVDEEDADEFEEEVVEEDEELEESDSDEEEEF